MFRYRMLGAAVLLLLPIFIALWYWIAFSSTPVERPSQVLTVEPSAELDELVTISKEKQVAANIKVAPVATRTLSDIRTVPGRVGYDETKRVELRLPTSCIVHRVLVQVGDHVRTGQVMSIVHSAEVAQARAEVLLRHEEWKIAERAFEFQQDIHDGVNRLLRVFAETMDPMEVQRIAQDLQLGKYRQQLLTAYSNFELAKRVASHAEAIRDSGAVPLRIVEQRRTDSTNSEALFRGLVEQTQFEAGQELATAKVASDHARRQLKISEEQLQTLLGYYESPDPVLSDEKDLSIVEIRAPIDGTVQAVHIAPMQRMEVAMPLLDVADTRQVWIRADIRDSEWEALGLQAGEDVQILCPSGPHHSFRGVVRFVGREVDDQSRAVPLVINVDNSDGHLRPGQFVTVQIPRSVTSDVMAVPEQAVVRRDAREFVFARRSDTEFQPVNVRTGVCADGWSEITEGLALGDVIVVEGAFVCKSEWLLAHEVE